MTAMSPHDDTTPDLDAFLESMPAGALNEKMGVRLTEVGPDRVVATMPVEGNTQPYGLLHGGATAALAETVGSIAAQAHAGPGRAAVGLELSITHHRSARAGTVRATATAVHLGRSSATYLVEVTDEADRRISSARLTCLLLDGASGSTTAGAAGNSAGATPS